MHAVCTHISELDRYEPHIVGTEEGIEQQLFQPDDQIREKQVHLLPHFIRRGGQQERVFWTIPSHTWVQTPIQPNTCHTGRGQAGAAPQCCPVLVGSHDVVLRDFHLAEIREDMIGDLSDGVTGTFPVMPVMERAGTVLMRTLDPRRGGQHCTLVIMYSGVGRGGCHNSSRCGPRMIARVLVHFLWQGVVGGDCIGGGAKSIWGEGWLSGGR